MYMYAELPHPTNRFNRSFCFDPDQLIAREIERGQSKDLSFNYIRKSVSTCCVYNLSSIITIYRYNIRSFALVADVDSRRGWFSSRIARSGPAERAALTNRN